MINFTDLEIFRIIFIQPIRIINKVGKFYHKNTADLQILLMLRQLMNLNIFTAAIIFWINNLNLNNMTNVVRWMDIQLVKLE